MVSAEKGKSNSENVWHSRGGCAYVLALKKKNGRLKESAAQDCTETIPKSFQFLSLFLFRGSRWCRPIATSSASPAEIDQRSHSARPCWLGPAESRVAGWVASPGSRPSAGVISVRLRLGVVRCASAPRRTDRREASPRREDLAPPGSMGLAVDASTVDFTRARFR